jgi:hypothetical protein
VIAFKSGASGFPVNRKIEVFLDSAYAAAVMRSRYVKAKSRSVEKLHEEMKVIAIFG